MPNPYESRTTQKLEFAKIYLELRKKSSNNCDLEERAHEESFLYHLVGAKDSFLQEINYALGLSIPEDKVKERSLRERLKGMGRECTALDDIEALEQEKGKWLDLAIWFRNHGTHRKNIPRFIYGGATERPSCFKNPYTGQELDEDIPRFFATCFEGMCRLIADLRSTLPPDKK